MSVRLLVNIEQPKFLLHVHVESHASEQISCHVCSCKHIPSNQHEKVSPAIYAPPTAKHAPRLLEWLIIFLVALLVVGWVVVAIITQNYFLASSIPILAEVLANTLHRMIDSIRRFSKATWVRSSEIQQQ